MNHNKKRFALIAALLSSFASAQAADVTGTVAMLEVWRNGNVAFTLSTPTTSCNGQFVLNASEPGTKNRYAALLAAKKTGSQVRVYSSGCVEAENYGTAQYNPVDYLYVID